MALEPLSSLTLLCPHYACSVSRTSAFTMDTYSHIIEGVQEDAMVLLDEVLLPAGVFEKNNANLTPIVDITSCKNQELVLCPCSSEDRAAVS